MRKKRKKCFMMYEDKAQELPIDKLKHIKQ